jgi:hypothetical protein
MEILLAEDSEIKYRVIFDNLLNAIEIKVLNKNYSEILMDLGFDLASRFPPSWK